METAKIAGLEQETKKISNSKTPKTKQDISVNIVDEVNEILDLAANGFEIHA